MKLKRAIRIIGMGTVKGKSESKNRNIINPNRNKSTNKSEYENKDVYGNENELQVRME